MIHFLFWTSSGAAVALGKTAWRAADVETQGQVAPANGVPVVSMLDVVAGLRPAVQNVVNKRPVLSDSAMPGLLSIAFASDQHLLVDQPVEPVRSFVLIVTGERAFLSRDTSATTDDPAVQVSIEQDLLL